MHEHPLPPADLTRARQGATVDAASIRSYLYGHASWEQHERVVRVMSKDPAFDNSKRAFMSRTELYARALAMSNHIYELQDQLGWSTEETRRAIDLLDESTPFVLHETAFEPVLRSQASEPLLSKYGALVANRGIVGCYLQTELGHGSNVAALETTATFLPATQEFEIHSPTLTSTKWWIGALGKTATHGVVQAQLILPDGKNAGPHLFFVQLRSLEDHVPMSGIVIGDIGPKAMGGTAPLDNGYARFDHVRIPHENMLSRFAQVTPDGRYVKPPHAKISYGGMLYIRSGMVTTAGRALAEAATISLRYATVRRQGQRNADGSEQQVIAYPSTYYRLVPILARAYVFIKLGRQLRDTFSETAERLASGDTSSLGEMHATTSGLKVLATTTSIRDVEVARRAMGGHGYSTFAGLGRLYARILPSATYEGDNFVLDQQVVRAAIKAYRALPHTGAQFSPSTRYLRLLLSPQPAPPALFSAPDDNPEQIVLLLEHRAARVVQAHMQTADEGALDAGAAQRLSSAVTDAFVARQVGDMILGLQASSLSAIDRAVIRQLYILYLLTTMEAGLIDFLSLGILPVPAAGGPDPVRALRGMISDLCLKLLPEAIGLSDAFGFTDWELDSALGVYDGRVYEALWERAKDSPLNEHEVTPEYERHIKPVLERGRRRAFAGKAKL
ncbi:peroxisomal oxidase [Artomyces pyxidatus]|uniref:Peroxisomal oxidase n=1 Tax=Artomyces pyxidatus TaxID=48021 RepID=A0ACB8T2T4_9AGAM|nr:peroxisomal oxidase [Artomyces pyxidatus]